MADSPRQTGSQRKEAANFTDSLCMLVHLWQLVTQPKETNRGSQMETDSMFRGREGGKEEGGRKGTKDAGREGGRQSEGQREENKTREGQRNRDEARGSQCQLR